MKRLLHIKEFWIHIIVWVCLLAFPMAIANLQYGKLEMDSLFLVRILANPALVYINYLVLVPKLLLRKKIGIYILISIATLVAFNFLVSNTLPATPFEEFQKLMKDSGIPPLKQLPYLIAVIISLSYFLLGGVLGLTKDFYRRERIDKEKEVHRKETELQFLRAQLNPHFLFNSLNSIYSLVRNKSLEAPEAVITLSELMRYMLYEAKQEVVPLSKEIDYIKNFVSLQLLRLSNSENVKLKISGEYKDLKIPPLLLVPFVENAFKYGTDFQGRTYVNIRFKIIDDHLFFFVKNKIGAHRKDTESSGIGLENIKNRLALLYPEDHLLRILKDNGFYNVQLEINLSK